MIIKSLELSDYRNYDKLSLKFNKGTNILYGDNAQGKTNILESIYLSGTTKSHRGSKEREIIQIGKDESHIRVFIEKDNITRKIDMHLKKNKSKGVAIDGIPIRKSSELFGMINLVFFSPEDLRIIKNGPSERRRFIDLELCQLDKIYLSNLTKYQKIINQRNMLLKQISFKPSLKETLNVWNIQLVEYGSKIIKSRFEFIERLNSIIYDIHKNLTGNKENLTIKYEPNIEIDNFYKKLIQVEEKDIQFKMTSVGPHRDDISFYINHNNVRQYGSQGQQRTSALSLKLA